MPYLLLATLLTSLLAMMTVAANLSAGIHNRKSLRKIDRIEGFYAAELAAWHARLRDESGLRLAESISIDDGTPPPDGVVDPKSRWIRRFSGSNLRHSRRGAALCGAIRFAQRRPSQNVCLVSLKSPTGWPELLVFLIPNSSNPGQVRGYNASGKPSSSFGKDGVVTLEPGVRTHAILFGRDKHLYCGMQTIDSDQQAHYRVERMKSDGSWDPTFSIALNQPLLTSQVYMPFTGWDDGAYYYFFTGWNDNDGQSVSGFSRLKHSGELDSAFGKMQVGIASIPVAAFNSRGVNLYFTDMRDAQVRESHLTLFKSPPGEKDAPFLEKSVAKPIRMNLDIRSTDQLIRVLSMCTEGERDLKVNCLRYYEFDLDGTPRVDRELSIPRFEPQSYDQRYGVQAGIQDDGKIFWIWPTETDEGDRRPSLELFRYLADGKPDATFGSNGRLVLDLPNSIYCRTQVHLRSVGDTLYLLCSDTETPEMQGYVFKIENGKWDQSFGQGGHVKFEIPRANGGIEIISFVTAPE